MQDGKRGPLPAATIVELVIREAEGPRGRITRLVGVLEKLGASKMSPADFAAVYDQRRLLHMMGCGPLCVRTLVDVLKEAGLVLPADGRGTRQEQDARAAALRVLAGQAP